MIHVDAITLVPVCANDDLRGLSFRRFLVKMTVRYTKGGLHLSPRCQTMMEFHRSVHRLQALLAQQRCQ